MRSLRRLLRVTLAVWALSAAGSAPGAALAAPPASHGAQPEQGVKDAAVEWVVAEFDRRESQLALRGVVTQREREELARQLAATLPLEALTPGQWAMLHSSPLFVLLDLQRRALDSLGPYLDRDDAQGAAALALHLYLRAEAGDLAESDDAERAALLRQVLTHPGLDEAVRRGWVPSLFRLLALLPVKRSQPLAEELFNLERVLTDDLPPQTLADLRLLYVRLRELTVLDASRAEALERIRLRMLELLRARMDRLPRGQQLEAARTAHLLESDWARNAAFPPPSPGAQPPEGR